MKQATAKKGAVKKVAAGAKKAKTAAAGKKTSAIRKAAKKTVVRRAAIVPVTCNPAPDVASEGSGVTASA